MTNIHYFYTVRQILCIIALFFNFLAVANDADRTIFTFKIGNEIDPRTNRLSKLALEKATEMKADLIILELNTYGGAVVDADSIRQRLLNCPIPIYAFIDKNAASAGALISIACDSIYMTEGSNIGAATVVFESGEAAPDKYQSYMRSMMRSTAEANGRDPRVAEAMVDQDLEVDSISTKGKVVTFTVTEAIQNGFCEGKVNQLEDILKINNIENYNLIRYEITIEEKIISWVLNPAISGILIMVIIGGIYYEIRTPGLGFPLAAACIAAALYFIPYYLNGLAAHWEMALFVVGLILLLLEIFYIPGFGVAGISGIIILFSSLFLVMIQNDLFDFTYVFPTQIFKSLVVIASAMVATFTMLFFGGLALTNTKAFNRIANAESMDREKGFISKAAQEEMTGKTGIVHAVLRPGGKVKIDGKVYSAESRGEFIDLNAEIIVIGEDTTSLIVRENKGSV